MKKRWWLLSLLLAGGCVLWLGQVVAESVGDKVAERMFRKADLDGDGVVTPEELPNTSLFGRLDKNRDHQISRAEAVEMLGPIMKPSASMVVDGNSGRVGAIFNKLDRDENGVLEGGELAWIGKIGEALDLNGDGKLTREEAQAGAKTASKLRGEVSAPPELVEADLTSVTQGPEILKAGDVGIGRQVPNLTFSDIDGGSHELRALASGQGAVIAFTSTTCPLSKRYAGSLARMEKALSELGVRMVMVNPFSSEKDAAIREQVKEFHFSSPYVRDGEMEIATALQADTTTEVFLVDARRTLIYRGALDDQYGLTYNLDEPRTHYLMNAVEAMIKGRRPQVAATRAPGCELDVRAAEATEIASADVSYHRDVSRILQQNCVECHRDQGIGPFALDDLEEVQDRARVIKRVIEEGTMPPWFAAKQGDASPWANDRALTETAKAELLAWLNSKDRKLGDPADAPEPLRFVEGWTLGEPNEVLQLPKAISIKAEGFMPYQFVSVPTHFTEDRWVSGYEILPTDRSVVHHVIVQVHEKGEKVVNRGEGAGGYWAAYVPGNSGHVYPEGFARKLPAGATVSFQIHYTPSGKATTDRLKLGLQFSEEPPLYEVRTTSIVGHKLNIPPGSANHVETASRRVPFDMPVTAFMAHMHVRGKAFRYDVKFPDGKEETLLDIPRYDFNWQLRYDYKQPRIIPKGSEVTVTAVFDNSAGNPANPDPTKQVRWGQQTYDEMLIGYVEYFVPLSAGAETAKR